MNCDAPMVGGNLGSSVVAVRDQSMRWMLRSLNMAADLGTELFVVHSPLTPISQERYWQRARQRVSISSENSTRGGIDT